MAIGIGELNTIGSLYSNVEKTKLTELLGNP